MVHAAGRTRIAGWFLGAVWLLVGTSWLGAQTVTESFPTGAAAVAWEKWSAAMKAILARDATASEAAFGELLALEPSAFRVALLAERTVQKTAEGGAVLLLEQDLESGKLGGNAKKVAEMLAAGREQMNEADDGWYFASIGRFDIAAANFNALLNSNPDPVALLEFADRVKRRQDILIQVMDNPIVGESARGVLRLLGHGERMIKADPARVKENIDRLGGPPRAFENGLASLKQSGEYAVPFLIQYLRDPSKRDMAPAILRALPQIDRAALNPLVMALRMDDQATKRYVISSLGQIGYPQSVPYLLKLRETPNTPGEIVAEVDRALQELQKRGVPVDTSQGAADSFFRLAEGYYNNVGSLAADARLDTANVWYWRDDMLVNIEVPTAIFNEIMAMRCCEEALLFNADHKPALALWLAANFRREAQLAEGQTDRTRPANYPSGAYFAQSAGAEYNLMALDRAVKDNDPAVALGAILALQKTAGPASILGGAEKQPLAEALSFSDRMVRIQAALALGRALPQQAFHNSQNLIPVLAEAVALQAGGRHALVVDAEEASANQVAGALRAAGYEVVLDGQLFSGLNKIRSSVPSLDVIFVASDVGEPGLVDGLAQLRKEFRFAATPVVVITKQADQTAVRELVRSDARLAQVPAGAGPEEINKALARVFKAVGAQALAAETGETLALAAAETLRLLAFTNNPVFKIDETEGALINALATKNAALRVAVAQTLSFIGSGNAQEAIARVALDEAEPEEMRVAMFGALADAARRHGNRLGEEPVRKLLAIAESDPNLTIRTAASQALGALNLPGNRGGNIIRNQYGG